MLTSFKNGCGKTCKILFKVLRRRGNSRRMSCNHTNNIWYNDPFKKKATKYANNKNTKIIKIILSNCLMVGELVSNMEINCM